MLALRQREAGLIETLAHGQDAFARERDVRRQAVEGHMCHREQRIAGVDRLRVAPHFPQRRTTAPQRIAVFDVVVDQREVVQQFDRGRGGQGGVPVAAGGFAGEQRQHRANAFAGIELRGLEIGIDPAQMIMQHAVKRRHASDHSTAATTRRISVSIAGRKLSEVL